MTGPLVILAMLLGFDRGAVIRTWETVFRCFCKVFLDFMGDIVAADVDGRWTGNVVEDCEKVREQDEDSKSQWKKTRQLRKLLANDSNSDATFHGRDKIPSSKSSEQPLS